MGIRDVKFAATNKEGTCLWCGVTLRRKEYPTSLSVRTTKAERAATGRRWTNSSLAKDSGYYADGYFCSAGCAYNFALTFAQIGRRLKPTE